MKIMIRTFSLVFTAGVLVSIASLAQDLTKETVGLEATVLLKTTKTAADQPISLPDTDKPEITSMLVTVQPKGHSSLHQHPIPVVAYILEGAVEVREGGVARKYSAGEAAVEPMNSPMQLFNPGDTIAKLLVVLVGAEGNPTSVAAH